MSSPQEVTMTFRQRLRPKQELFCQLYATDREFFGNGTAAYIEAYNPSRLSPSWYQAARGSAHTLLTKPNICERINELLEDGGLNDMHVDKQLHFLITQHADFTAKLGGIREYNKLKARVTDTLKVSGTIKLQPVAVMDVTPPIPVRVTLVKRRKKVKAKQLHEDKQQTEPNSTDDSRP